jgi:hypothetical protein
MCRPGFYEDAPAPKGKPCPESSIEHRQSKRPYATRNGMCSAKPLGDLQPASRSDRMRLRDA